MTLNSSFKVIINKAGGTEPFDMSNQLISPTQTGQHVSEGVSIWAKTGETALDHFDHHNKAGLYHVYIEFNKPNNINSFQFFNGHKGYPSLPSGHGIEYPTIDKLFFFDRALTEAEVESLATET